MPPSQQVELLKGILAALRVLIALELTQRSGLLPEVQMQRVDQLIEQQVEVVG